MSEQHYFSGAPLTPDRRHEVTAQIWGVEHRFTTASGVFAAAGLDRATALLLQTDPPAAASGRLLDLGCGWGPIAVALATACPQATIDAVDVNPRALELCTLNALRSGVGERVHPLLPDQVAPEVTYDEIWSNPPIRVGKEALHDLLLTWLARLAPGGTARLVVGKNLGADSLQRWLQNRGLA